MIITWFRSIESSLKDRILDSYGTYYLRKTRRYVKRLIRAHIYSMFHASHRYKRFQVNVSRSTPIRDYPVAAAVPVQRYDSTDAVLLDAVWVRKLRAEVNNSRLILSGAEGPEHRVQPNTPDVGRNPHTDGTNNRTEIAVHPQSGGSDHRRHEPQSDRGRVQRAAQRIPARFATLLDLVHADDFAFPVPQLRRLPEPAR